MLADRVDQIRWKQFDLVKSRSDSPEVGSRQTCNISRSKVGGETNTLQAQYSQLSLRRTPLGPALSVRLREVSIL